MKKTSSLIFAIGLVLLLGPCPVALNAQPLFEDVAPQLGIADNEPCGNPFWYDYDNDGDLDLLRSAHYSATSYLYRNDITSFHRLTSIGLPSEWDAGKCIPTDFDHDGDLDIIVAGYFTAHALLVNNNGIFLNRTTAMGLPNQGGNRDLDWLDWNGDGWMDLLWQTRDGWRLYRNNNGLSFSEITSQAGLPDDDGGGFALSDIDLDGDLDMFATRIEGTGKFWLNYGNGIFVDFTTVVGLNNIPASAGCVWVDFNHDKYPDLLTQNYGSHGIWLNMGNGTFQAMRVHGMEADFSDWPHGAWYSVADYDMDGMYDVYCTRPGCCGCGSTPNELFHQDSTNGMDIWFTNIAAQFGMNVNIGGCSQWTDFDDDGDLDLSLISQDEPIHLWRNNTINNSNRLQVRVLGPNGEQDQWFSRVEIYPHGNPQVHRAAELSYHAAGSNGLRHYFTLNADAAYDIKVYFPNGETMTFESYPELSNVIPSQIGNLLTVHMGVSVTPEPPEMISDFRLDGAFPNPFNPETVIHYSLPNAGHVRLSVYDLLGRQVADLVNGMGTGGAHTLTWNAARLPAGMYFIELSAGSNRAISKVLLMK